MSADADAATTIATATRSLLTKRFILLIIALLLFFNTTSVHTVLSQFLGKESVSVPQATSWNKDNATVISKEGCKVRTLPAYNASTWVKPKALGNNRTIRYDQCLRFKCDYDDTRCDTMLPTDFDGPKPPCCVHILRDMNREFDEAMCELGFEYFAAYGTALGLIRSDRLVPWTIDNDYVVSKVAALALLTLPQQEKEVLVRHGLHLLMDNFVRLCVTPNFVGGKLAARWTVTKPDGWYPLHFVYSDLFLSNLDASGTKILDELKCSYDLNATYPVQRRPVYNSSFHMSVPNNAEALLEMWYGKNWKKPDANKSRHGNTSCRNREK